MDMQLAIDVLQMPADRLDTDAQSVCDFLVVKTEDDQFQYFALARGEFFYLGRGECLSLKILDDFARDDRAHRHTALLHVPDGVQYLFGRLRLKEITRSADAE